MIGRSVEIVGVQGVYGGGWGWKGLTFFCRVGREILGKGYKCLLDVNMEQVFYRMFLQLFLEVFFGGFEGWVELNDRENVLNIKVQFE